MIGHTDRYTSSKLYCREMSRCCNWVVSNTLWFNLGSSIANDIHAALLFDNCDILGVKIIRIDPLEPNIWLSYVSYAVWQLFLTQNFGPLADSKSQQSFMKQVDELLVSPRPPAHFGDAITGYPCDRGGPQGVH